METGGTPNELKDFTLAMRFPGSVVIYHEI